MWPPYGGDPPTQGGSSTGPGVVPPRPGQPVFRPPASGATVPPRPGQPAFQQKPPQGPQPGALLTGTVKSYSAKGFGFILCPEVEHDVYFARESLQDGLRTANIAGTVVQFVLQRGLHGKPQATYLRPLEGQIAPTEYNRGYVEKHQPAPAAPAFVPPPAAAVPAFAGKGGCFGQVPGGMPQMQQQHQQHVMMPPQTMPQYGQQFAFPAGHPGYAPPGQFSHVPPVVQPRPAGWPMGQQPGAAMGAALSAMLNMRPPIVTPQKRLSPHAGSRALAGQPPAGASAGKKDDSSDRGSSDESSRDESDSSSSDKKKKKKKVKKKKGSKKDKKEKKDRSRSRSARKKSKSRKSSGSRSRLSVSSSSRERSQPKEAASSSEGQKNIENAKREVLQQLENLKKIEPKDVRMKEWRSLLRSWHPDKNPDKTEVATAVFQFLQKGKLLLDL